MKSLLEVRKKALKSFYAQTMPGLVNSIRSEEDLEERKISLVEESTVKKIEKVLKSEGQPLNLEIGMKRPSPKRERNSPKKTSSQPFTL